MKSRRERREIPTSWAVSTACAGVVFAAIGSFTSRPSAARPPIDPPASTAAADSSSGPQRPATPAGGVVTRADLARSYMRFDRVFMEHPPAPERLGDVNRAFDKATLEFFSGSMQAVAAGVDSLTRSLLPEGAAWPDVGPPALSAEDLAGLDAHRERVLTRLGEIRAARARSREVAVSGHEADDADTGLDPLDRALRIAEARARTLTSSPSVTESSQFLADYRTLASSIDREVDALSGGENPYRRLAGHHWRVVRFGENDVPCRVYAPKIAAGDELVPLIIAFHGAGGDEAMFPESYGGGLITRLADERGFVVASPLTYPFMGATAGFDALVADLSADYSIDPSRIHVIGHSLGGAATSYLAVARSKAIASACAIAGSGGFSAKKPPCPLMIVAGELDPIAPPARLRQTYERASKSGLPVEYREIKEFGHTLVVGAALPGAVEWMLTHRRRDADTPGAGQAPGE